tara:strand:- start:19 stop:1587 length:1569 start_codon:yes stop_codon:yes gene_type:complete
MATVEELITARDNARAAGRDKDAKILDNAAAKMLELPEEPKERQQLRAELRQPLPDGSYKGGVDFRGQDASNFQRITRSAVAGLGNAFAKPVYGAIDAVTGGDSSDKIQTLQNLQDTSPVGAVSNFTGEVAKYALPGVRVAKYGMPAVFGAETLGAGAIKSLETPEEGDTRLNNATTEAAFNAAAFGGGEVLKKALSGIDVGGAARQYLDSGGYMTPGSAATNPSVKWVEAAMKVFPGFARKTADLQERALQEYSPHITQDITARLDPTLNLTPHTGPTATQDAMREMGATVDRLYDDAWDAMSFDKMKEWHSIGRDRFMRDVTRKGELFTKDNQAQLKRIAEAANQGIQRADEKIRQAMGSAEGDFLDALKELRTSLRARGGPEMTRKLDHVDGLYPEVLGATNAAAARSSSRGRFTPRAHANSLGGVQSNRIAAEGGVPGQQYTEELAESFEPQNLGLVSSIGKSTQAIPIHMPYMEGTGNMLVGNTAPQRKFRELISDDETLNKIRALNAAALTATIGD